MRNFNNTMNYFFQKFYSNLKYSNRILHSLRIFFERTTKNINVVSWLGNVYRNSKWSSLNIQNIKPSFKYQAISIFSIYTFLLLILYMFKHNLSILQFFLFTPSYFWYIVQDWLSYTSLLLLSLFYFSIQKLDIIFSNFLPNFFLSVNNNNSTKHLNNSILISRVGGKKFVSNNSFVQSLKNDDVFLNVTSQLQKTINTLNLVNYVYLNSNINFKNNTINFENLTKFNKKYTPKLFLLTSNDFNINMNYNSKFSIIEHKFKFTKQKGNVTYNGTLDLNTFLKFNFLLQKITTSNLSKNLNLAKQNRWFWKNSILSDKTIIQLNKMTHLKKLVSNPELNPLLTKYNIWGSSKLSNNNFFDLNLTNNLTNTDNRSVNQFFNYFSSPTNLNRYEDSVMWLVKRLSFTQKMNYNNQSLTTKDRYESTSKFNNNNTINNLIFNKFYYNYNLLNLNISFYKIFTFDSINNKPNLTSSDLVNTINVNNQELFTNNDTLFLKSLITNISFKKNNVIFYSYF